jgi:CheY-like chemotaxis protein
MPQERKTILLVDPDPEHAWGLCEELTEAGYTVTDTLRAEYAYEIMKERSFDVAILDVLASRFRGVDLIEMLLKDLNHPLIICTADFETSVVQRAVANRGAHHFLPKPVSIKRLVKLIAPPPVFSGQVEGVDILDFVQFMLLTGKRTIVEIRSEDGRACQVFVDKGEILHAATDGSEGEEAFFECMNFRNGKFTNLPWTDPPRTSISRPPMSLLMEAARLRDES